jgi:hypothetical protein
MALHDDGKPLCERCFQIKRSNLSERMQRVWADDEGTLSTKRIRGEANMSVGRNVSKDIGFFPVQNTIGNYTGYKWAWTSDNLAYFRFCKGCSAWAKWVQLLIVADKFSLTN